MRATVSNAREQLRSSVWFIPSICVVAAFVLSWALLALDEWMPGLAASVRWLFRGTAESARTLLQTIATAVIGVVAVAFSLTLVALQQAASRYTPRVLHTFRRDRNNHVVLGTYIGTFTYALLVMRQVRTPDADNGGFVPALAISTTIALALLSLAMLVFFIHHMIRSLEVSFIVTSIHKDLQDSLNELFPSTFGAGADDEAVPPEGDAEGTPHRADVCIRDGGYLRRIDENDLAAATRHARCVRVNRRIGDFVLRGSAIATIYSEAAISPAALRRVRDAFVLGRERSIEQDPLFGIRQLVDIAVKALSPGVNDPATAEEALAELAETVATLLDRQIPSPLRRAEGEAVYRFERPGFSDFVEACFGQARRAARNDLHVTMSLLSALEELLHRAPSDGRRRALRAQIEAVLADLEATSLPERDRAAVRARTRALLAGATTSQPASVAA